MAEKTSYVELVKRVEVLEQAIRNREFYQQALEESEKKFQNLFDCCPVGIIICQLADDETLVIKEANRAAEAILGKNCDQFIGKNIEEAFPMLAGTKISATYKAVAVEGKIWRNEHIDCTCSDTSSALKVACLQTRPGEIACIFEGISHQKKARKALLETKEKYRLLSEGTFEAVVWHDHGRIIEANEQYYDMFGYRPNELAGKDAVSLTAAPNSQQLIREQISSGNMGPYQVEGLRKDGTTFPLEIRVKKMNYKGRTARMAAIRDMTGQIEAKAALDKSERKYKTLIENANSIILRWDADGRIIYLNPYGCEYFKYKKNEIIGSHVVGTIVPGEETTGRDLRKMIENIIADPMRYRNNINQNVRGDGKRVWVAWTNVAIVDDDSAFVEILSIGNDVSKLISAESALKRREKQLKEQTRHLAEVNTAMKVLLKKREEDKNDLEERILTNVKQLVGHYLDKLKHSGLNGRQKTYVDIIDSNLGEIVSPFLKRLSGSYLALTPAEVRVAELIKQGKTSKEIAELFNQSPRTIEFHRDNIRKKMGLNNRKTNLRSHLLSIQ